MKTAVLFSLTIIATSSVYAQQDALFTHYAFNTLAINPAYAGSRDAMTVTALHRSQWVGFDGAPSTQTITIHTPLAHNKMGLGLSAMHDKIGPVSTSSVYLDYAYKIPVGKHAMEGKFLALGVKGGLSFAQTSLMGLNATTSGDPAVSGNSNGYVNPNVGVGIHYYSRKGYFGISAPKLIETPVSTSTRTSEKRHYYAIFGKIMKVNANVQLKPTALIRITSAAPMQADLSALFVIRNKFEIGPFYRTGDALGMLVGFNFKEHLRVGYGFDWSRGMRTGAYNSGSHEIMLRYDFIKVIKEPVVSPRYF